MKGIDISENNGYIDFNKVKQSGIDFVIIRVGWIGNKNNHTLDKYFHDYYNKAKEVGLKIGFYVYSYCNSITSTENACVWLEHAILGKTFDMPLFLDLEDKSITMNKDMLTTSAKVFCNYFETRGIKTGIYANKSWFTNRLDINQLISYKIWLAEWNNKENHTANFRVDLWQYSSNGDINGISGRVDMNKCINCQNLPQFTEGNVENLGGEFQVKIYQNGTTKENVYSDKNLTNLIGYLHPHETAECYGIVDNKAIIVYNQDGTSNKKCGFVKWLGGIKN